MSRYLLLGLAVIFLLFSSCQRDPIVINLDTGNQGLDLDEVLGEINMEDLVVPEGFNYQMFEQIGMDLTFKLKNGETAEGANIELIGFNEDEQMDVLNRGIADESGKWETKVDVPFHFENFALKVDYDTIVVYYEIDRCHELERTFLIDDLNFHSEQVDDRSGCFPSMSYQFGEDNKSFTVRSSKKLAYLKLQLTDGTEQEFLPVDSKTFSYDGPSNGPEVYGAWIKMSCMLNHSANEFDLFLKNPEFREDIDGDGCDAIFDWDDYNPNLNFAHYFPSLRRYGTLAFEDLWPNQGDYDFNDLVVGFQQLTITNSRNQIWETITNLEVRAVGAAFDNDLAVLIPKPILATVPTVLSPNPALEYEIIDLGTQLVIVIKKVKSLFNMTDLVNVRANQVKEPAVPIQIVSEYAGEMNYPQDYMIDIFLIVGGEQGHEVHIAGNEPTSLMDTYLLGTGDDATDIGESKYFLTENNLPWGLFIPRDWDHPLEGVQIIDAYYRFQEYAEEKPELPWYRQNNNFRNPNFVFDIVTFKLILL